MSAEPVPRRRPVQPSLAGVGLGEGPFSRPERNPLFVAGQALDGAGIRRAAWQDDRRNPRASGPVAVTAHPHRGRSSTQLWRMRRASSSRSPIKPAKTGHGLLRHRVIRRTIRAAESAPNPGYPSSRVAATAGGIAAGRAAGGGRSGAGSGRSMVSAGGDTPDVEPARDERIGRMTKSPEDQRDESQNAELDEAHDVESPDRSGGHRDRPQLAGLWERLECHGAQGDDVAALLARSRRLEATRSLRVGEFPPRAGASRWVRPGRGPTALTHHSHG